MSDESIAQGEHTADTPSATPPQEPAPAGDAGAAEQGGGKGEMGEKGITGEPVEPVPASAVEPRPQEEAGQATLVEAHPTPTLPSEERRDDDTTKEAAPASEEPVSQITPISGPTAQPIPEPQSVDPVVAPVPADDAGAVTPATESVPIEPRVADMPDSTNLDPRLRGNDTQQDTPAGTGSGNGGIVTPSPKSFLAKALERIQFRKRAKLDKIVKLAEEKHSLTNDQVEKLLRVSDSTASRYLNALVKQGRLKVVGAGNSRRYEPLGGSNGGN